jgi:hypothetical protein
MSINTDCSLVANHDATLIQPPLGELPTLKGYLNKYTNVAKGYNPRWLVLKDGILSCSYTNAPFNATR